MNSTEELERRYPGHILKQEPLANHTNYRLGGPADLFAEVTSLDELTQLITAATDLQIPWIVLGNCTNVLVADTGIRGLVIKNQARHYEIKPAENSNYRHVYGESGVLLAALAKETVRQGLAGLQYAIDIPGSLGGGIVSNAAGHGHQLSQVVRGATILCDGVDQRYYTLEQLGLGYRTSIFKDKQRPRDVILSIDLEMQIADPAILQVEADSILARRNARLPRDPSAGSTFKNPPGHLVAQLIEECGLKGHRIGNAQISPKHSNFFINAGSAQAADVKALIDLARNEVKKKFGLDLELEVELLGDW